MLAKSYFIMSSLLCSMLLANETQIAFKHDINEQKKLVVVTCSYNNKNWYKQNLDSVFMQKYQNYHLIYMDDCSSDGTGELVQSYIKERGFEDRVTLVRNEARVGAMANHFKAVYMCDDRDIIVQLDGDDILAHERVLETVNRAYADPNIWLAYSQFVMWPSRMMGWNDFFSKHLIDTSRERTYAPTHLRTFYAALFKKIKIEDFMYEGKFLEMTCDKAMMLPMVEMARNGHLKFINEVLYIYNDDNTLNDHRINKKMQWDLDLYLRAKKRYEALDQLFVN